MVPIIPKNPTEQLMQLPLGTGSYLAYFAKDQQNIVGNGQILKFHRCLSLSFRPYKLRKM
jgi:hypothetical protein